MTPWSEASSTDLPCAAKMAPDFEHANGDDNEFVGPIASAAATSFFCEEDRTSPERNISPPVQTLMAWNSRRQRINHLGTAFAIHIGAYCSVAGFLILVLIFLHQPYRSPNPGLAAYDSPPRTVIKHLPPSRRPSQALPVVLPAATAAEPETTGRAIEPPEVQRIDQSMLEPERRPNPAVARKPKPPKELRRETQAELSRSQSSPCIPGYDGSGAQTRWC